LTEGKFSFPIVHCIHHHPSRKDQLLSILRQRTNDLDIKKYAISLLQESGSLEYTRQYLVRKEEEARQEVARLGGNVILEEILTYLSKEYIL
jgi:geranylgeranyl diphosphate synthase type 3